MSPTKSFVVSTDPPGSPLSPLGPSGPTRRGGDHPSNARASFPQILIQQPLGPHHASIGVAVLHRTTTSLEEPSLALWSIVITVPAGTMTGCSPGAGCRVGFTASAVPNRHVACPETPLAAIKACDNVFVIESDWYQANPLVLKGPGAGRLVTAGGIHADLAILARQQMAAAKAARHSQAQAAAWANERA